jgi:hypothetical protein
MKQELFKDKYPIYTLEIAKNKTMDELVEYFKTKIQNHPIAGFITLFDHYGYTTAKEEHNVAEGIVDVKNVIFCFGKEIANPKVPAVRPRSIAITEMQDSFIISFLEAPNEKLTLVMVDWVKELEKEEI